MPRSFSSGALSISSKGTYSAKPRFAKIRVIAAVSVVLPWSMCPIVPTFTCGLVRSNFALPMSSSRLLKLGYHLFRHGLWRRFIVRKLHSECRSTLCKASQIRSVSEHPRQWHSDSHGLSSSSTLHAEYFSPSGGKIPQYVSEEFSRRDHLDIHDGFQE